MKKVIVSVVILAMLTTSGVASAAKLGQYGNKFNQEKSKPVIEAVYKGVYKKDNANANNNLRRAEMQERRERIRQNRTELEQLKREVKAKTAQIRAEIKELRANPDELTEEKVAQIRQQLTLIRSDRQELAKTKGKIVNQTEQLRLKKRDRDMEGMLGNFNHICAVQEERIVALKKLNADLDSLLETLK